MKQTFCLFIYLNKRIWDADSARNIVLNIPLPVAIELKRSKALVPTLFILCLIN